MCWVSHMNEWYMVKHTNSAGTAERLDNGLICLRVQVELELQQIDLYHGDFRVQPMLHHLPAETYCPSHSTE